MSSSIDMPPLQELYIHRWIRGQFTKPIPPADGLDLSTETGILVGATDGIGLVCARVLLERQLSTLILGARNIDKGKVVAKTLKEEFPSSDIQVWELELLSYDSVQSFAERCATLPRIDFAILGAGVLTSNFRLSPTTGHEVTIQVHYWSTVLLSLLLLPILERKHVKDKPAHLTIISSDLAYIAEFKEGNSNPLLPAFDRPIPWSNSTAIERYNSSKLLLMMFVAKLKNLVDPIEVIVNTVCPGMSKPTANEREQPWIPRTFSWVLRVLLGRSLNTCAWLYVNAAVEQGIESHGSYIASWQISPFPQMMYTEAGKELADRAWKETLGAFESANIKNLPSFIAQRE